VVKSIWRIELTLVCLIKNRNFCTRRCFEEWFGIYGDRAIDLIGRKTERTINYNNINIYIRRRDLAVNLPNGWLDYDNNPQIRQQIETQLLSELQSNNNA
jgi:hypothetical protein